jgi:hypothetical protein
LYDSIVASSGAEIKHDIYERHPRLSRPQQRAEQGAAPASAARTKHRADRSRRELTTTRRVPNLHFSPSSVTCPEPVEGRGGADGLDCDACDPSSPLVLSGSKGRCGTQGKPRPQLRRFVLPVLSLWRGVAVREGQACRGVALLGAGRRRTESASRRTAGKAISADAVADTPAPPWQRRVNGRWEMRAEVILRTATQGWFSTTPAEEESP